MTAAAIITGCLCAAVTSYGIAWALAYLHYRIAARDVRGIEGRN